MTTHVDWRRHDTYYWDIMRIVGSWMGPITIEANKLTKIIDLTLMVIVNIGGWL